MTASPHLPCAGLSVVEVATGASDLGLGLAGGLPGMILADLGAAVTRLVGSPAAIDDGLVWSRAWHRDKQIVLTNSPDEIRRRLDTADIALVYGSEDLVEQRGLGWDAVRAANPSLVYGRCRASTTALGPAADYGLLVEARAGFCTQLAGHRPGPIFPDVHASGSGAAFLLTASVLALLRRRALVGTGGWAESSLYDGMLATLGCMIGRSERAAPEVEGYWQKGSTFPNFLYRCSDGELIQVWFGGKGMYAKLLDALGDEPSPNGYYADQVTGALNARAERWRAVFATRPRQEWMDRLRAVGVACEPVLAPGDVLSDPHAAEVGLTTTRSVGDHRQTFVATPIRLQPGDQRDGSGDRRRPPARPAPLLEGVRVVDFSAFVAGPLAAQVLADLGADVIKVEPPSGEAMRAAAYAVAACQRGKRSLALDITAPEARPTVERLLRWADVVLHNFRVGVAERLGIDEATVAALNPGAVYCHASAFGTHGPRATSPGNDALMQALSGFERAVGGAGNDPIAATWIPIDVSSGWVSAAGILAGLYQRAVTGRGCRVDSSLLGAAMLLQSGVYQADGEPRLGPHLDAGQTGYGPGYRLYRCADERWLAVVIPSPEAWRRLRSLPEASGLPEDYLPLRRSGHDAEAKQAEEALEAVLATAPAAVWATRLRAEGILVEPVEEVDRDQFRRGVLDDPVNRQLGRVADYATPDWGRFEQIGPLLRCGPEAGAGPRLLLPGVGEHTIEVLRQLGADQDEVDELLAAKVAHQLPGTDTPTMSTAVDDR